MRAPVLHVFHEHAGHIADRLRAAGVAWEIVPWSDPAQLREGIGEVENLFTESPPRDVWASASRLRLIQTMGAGVDGLLPAPDLPPGVAITNARGVLATEVAEHALMMMLALQRNLAAHVKRQSERAWRPFASGSLAGRTVGILGLGEIGGRAAALCAAFGMRVLGVCRRPREVPHVDEVAGVDRLSEVLGQVDHLVVALPLTPATRGLLGFEALRALRPGAFLVHVGRGGVIDERALLEGLRTGHVGGAALDVFEEEPLPPDHPLWMAPNTLITPHVAGHGLRYIDRVAGVLVDNVGRLLRGEALVNRVDREEGY
jgi:phosphoglycerate dehydrogenase-like enzyme